jgi:hypothetical protein
MTNARGLVRTATLNITQAALVCGPSESRVALLFSPPAAADRADYYTISTDPNVVLGGGINVLSTGGPVSISAAAHGDAAHRPWYAIASVGMTVGYLESVLT